MPTSAGVTPRLATPCRYAGSWTLVWLVARRGGDCEPIGSHSHRWLRAYSLCGQCDYGGGHSPGIGALWWRPTVLCPLGIPAVWLVCTSLMWCVNLNTPCVVVPRVAVVLSAWGMLVMDLRYELVRTHVGQVHKVGSKDLRRLFAVMEANGRTRLAMAFSGSIGVRRAASMRYGEQIFHMAARLGPSRH